MPHPVCRVRKKYIHSNSCRKYNEVTDQVNRFVKNLCFSVLERRRNLNDNRPITGAVGFDSEVTSLHPV